MDEIATKVARLQIGTWSSTDPRNSRIILTVVQGGEVTQIALTVDQVADLERKLARAADGIKIEIARFMAAEHEKRRAELYEDKP
jgi:hypothetical protein